MNSYTMNKMYKPDEQHIFKCVNGTWREMGAGDSAPTLAEFLKQREIVVDESAQFERMYRYHKDYHEVITYRAWNMAQVTITYNYYPYE